MEEGECFPAVCTNGISLTKCPKDAHKQCSVFAVSSFVAVVVEVMADGNRSAVAIFSSQGKAPLWPLLLPAASIPFSIGRTRKGS